MLNHFPHLRTVLHEVGFYCIEDDDRLAQWSDVVHDLLPEPDACEDMDEYLSKFTSSQLRDIGIGAGRWYDVHRDRPDITALVKSATQTIEEKGWSYGQCD